MYIIIIYISLVLCFPFATEFGIFVVYFLDYIVGSAWWVIVLHLVCAELQIRFMSGTGLG